VTFPRRTANSKTITGSGAMTIPMTMGEGRSQPCGTRAASAS
jgi:hypothetical protein